MITYKEVRPLEDEVRAISQELDAINRAVAAAFHTRDRIALKACGIRLDALDVRNAVVGQQIARFKAQYR